jgi:L-fuculose-phosphate aldolase
MKYLSARTEMCEIGRRLWERGLVGATEGNISLRVEPDRILCTPTGLCKGQLKPVDLTLIDGNGRPLEKTLPSSEIRLHVRILQRRSDCVAVIHAHPPVATGFALAGETIPDDLMPEAAMVLGSVVNVPYAKAGTDEVPDGIEPYLAGHKTFLLANHGAAVIGKNLEDAFYRMETLERIANVVLFAKLIAKPRPLPAEAFDDLKPYLTGDLG